MTSKCERCGGPTKLAHKRGSPPRRFCSPACASLLKTQYARQAREKTPCPPPIDGAVWIPLNRGKFALVDSSDAERVSALTWTAVPRDRSWYAFNAYSDVMLHRFLLPTIPEIDHIDGDGLNNRRSNLRRATCAKNQQNKRKACVGVSRFKGVCPHSKHDGRWRANIRTPDTACGRGRQTHLGLFVDEEAAARAYDAAARKHFGEFARLNFPEPGEQSALRKVE